MAGTFKFELVSPERILFSDEAEQVVVPGSEGEFTVLPEHAPVVSTLRPGIIQVQLPGARRRLFVKGGFAEVDPERLTILAEHALDMDEVDAERLREELSAAEAELANSADEGKRAQLEEVVERLRGLQQGQAR